MRTSTKSVGSPTQIQAPVIRYCLYARKSMEAEERQALSIDSQLMEMQRIAERDGLEIACMKTEAHSAKDSGQREVFNSVVEDLVAGKYNGILTWAPDRLSRNAGDLGKLVDLMDKGSLAEIRTFNQHFTNSPNEKFLLMILCSQAKLENDNKAINVKRGLRMRCEMGLWPAPAPTGYLTSMRKDQKGTVELDPERAPIIRKMFELVANDGWSARKVYYWIRSTGFRTVTGKLISLATVQVILRKQFYYGAFEYPKNSGKWYTGVHPPIITKKLFDTVQKYFKKYKAERKEHIREFPFVRLIRCGLCDSGVTAEEKFKSLKSGGVARYVYYGCGRTKNPQCRALYMREEEILRQLAGLIDGLDLDLLGMREKIEWEIERWYKVHGFLVGQPVPDRSIQRKEADLRQYAKMVLLEGTYAERRELLSFLNSRLIMKDKAIYLAKDKRVSH